MSIEAGGINPIEVADGVDALTWPKERFDHRGHLAAGAWWCHVYGPAALDHARTAIRRFNEANGGENTDTAGYHETLSVYFLAAIADLLGEAAPDREWLERHSDDVSLGQAAPQRYWSEAVLTSAEARLSWVDPDEHPLPDGVQRQVDRLLAVDEGGTGRGFR